MKRSELQAKIISILVQNMGVFAKSSKIIDMLEEVGIEPPAFPVEVGSGYLDDEGFEMSEIEWCQGWENE